VRRRVVFFGSPAWAVPVLEALAERHDVVLAVTQPDKPAGRGLKLKESPVATRAKELGIPVLKPKRLKKNAEFLEAFRELSPDAAVVAAYGKIIPPEVLAVPKHGFLNLHPSLLPKYRGAAPVNWALIEGETETGVSIMRLDEGMDTGPLYRQLRVPIRPEETAAELSERLRDLGIPLLLEVLENLENETPRPQEGEPSYAPLLTKEDGRIRFEEPSERIYARHRGVKPWPGGFGTGGSGSRSTTFAPSPARGSRARCSRWGPKGS